MAGKKEIKEEVVEVAVKESEAKAKLRAHFEAYKIHNPVKWEQKKESFQKQLDAMK